MTPPTTATAQAETLESLRHSRSLAIDLGKQLSSIKYAVDSELVPRITDAQLALVDLVDVINRWLARVADGETQP